MFYASMVLMLVFQIWNASLAIRFYNNEPDCDILFAANEIDTCAIYSAALFGLIQAANIIELLIFTKNSTIDQTETH